MKEDLRKQTVLERLNELFQNRIYKFMEKLKFTLLEFEKGFILPYHFDRQSIFKESRSIC